MHKHTAVLRVGFEPTIAVFEHAKTFRVLDSAATTIVLNVTNILILIGSQKFKLSVY